MGAKSGVFRDYINRIRFVQRSDVAHRRAKPDGSGNWEGEAPAEPGS